MYNFQCCRNMWKGRGVDMHKTLRLPILHKNEGRYYTSKKRRNVLFGLLFILPSFAGCAVFVLIPFVDVIRRSFTLGFTAEFVWFYNYIDIFQNSAFRLATVNTLRFVGICVPLLLLISLVLALLLNQKVMGRGMLRAAFLVPLAIPVASVALLWQILFHQNGLMGNLLVLLGSERIDWMRTDWALLCLIISYIWKNVGYNIVLFLAGLSNISVAQYEAARIDGANSFRIFRDITWPA